MFMRGSDPPRFQPSRFTPRLCQQCRGVNLCCLYATPLSVLQSLARNACLKKIFLFYAVADSFAAASRVFILHRAFICKGAKGCSGLVLIADYCKDEARFLNSFSSCGILHSFLFLPRSGRALFYSECSIVA